MTVMVQTTTNYNAAGKIVSVIVFRVPVEDNKMTPTDAQIMRKALEEIAEDPTGVSIYQAEIAKTALTAAAEVGGASRNGRLKRRIGIATRFSNICC